MSTTEADTLVKIDSPDFYWKFRLERMATNLGGSLPFNAGNYPRASGYKELYKAYYLDLAINGKCEGYDWDGDREVSDEDWKTIYNEVAEWTKKTVKANKPTASTLPASDIDLLRQFYPSIDTREMDTPFVAEEVGENFPYRNMKAMLDAASAGKLSVPGYSKDITDLDVNATLAKLDKMEADAIAKLDALEADALAFAMNPFPDDKAKAHYRKIRETLGTFPQGAAAWATYRSNDEKVIEEMARLAAKKDEHHHHHEEEGEEGGDHHHKVEKMSTAQEFEVKYGRNLEEMEERYAMYKANPATFMEKNLEKKYGKKGIDAWKASQEINQQLALLSDSEKKALEAEYSAFLAKA